MARPTKKSTDRKDTMVNVRLDLSLAQKLNSATQGKDISQAQVIRQALREFFERHEAA